MEIWLIEKRAFEDGNYRPVQWIGGICCEDLGEKMIAELLDSLPDGAPDDLFRLGKYKRCE